MPSSNPSHPFINISSDWDVTVSSRYPTILEDTGSPWEGSVMYRRNASVTHVEYCTTLERLGLGRLSTEVSKKRASAMGLRVTKDVKDYPDGTPVQVSVDVIRKKKKLRPRWNCQDCYHTRLQ